MCVWDRAARPIPQDVLPLLSRDCGSGFEPISELFRFAPIPERIRIGLVADVCLEVFAKWSESRIRFRFRARSVRESLLSLFLSIWNVVKIKHRFRYLVFTGTGIWI
jgi:hypothetical protein